MRQAEHMTTKIQFGPPCLQPCQLIVEVMYVQCRIKRVSGWMIGATVKKRVEKLEDTYLGCCSSI
jgi:hypothetical protein